MNIIQTIGTALNQALSDERLQSFSNSDSFDGSSVFAFKTMSGESFEFTFHRDGTTQPPVPKMLSTLERLGIDYTTEQAAPDETTEQAYMEGQRAVWRNLVWQGLSYFEGNEKARTELIIERADAIRELKTLCEEFSLPVKWDDDLRLADIIEKHVYRPLRDLLADSDDE